MTKNMMLVLVLVLSTGCATARTRSSDPVMRVAIDSGSMPLNSYVRLQRSLVESGKFVVVDRAAGFKFINKEQKLQHQSDRFGADEKYAEWGKLYGVGGVVVGIQSCQMRDGWGGQYYRCMENLALLDVTTGETLAVSEDTQDTEGKSLNPEWNKAVDMMIDNFPKTFVTTDNLHQTIKYSKTLQNYRDQISQQKDRKPAAQDDDEQNNL